ncbi:MAG: low molecular weight phosphotyrosine protein phosphatase [Hydrococcus sp. CRU_1_1]|nr:low molecular weight phosphotyrosine protein phosphatase [Hydrococcus sp. CRU_1_1]
MPYKLLFVCLGNICRSPAAENIMNHLIVQAGLSESSTETLRLSDGLRQRERIICDSAGTSSYHIGSPPDRRMSAAAAMRGISMTGRARQFQVADFENYDLILAMDKDNYLDILALDPRQQYRHKVRLMCEFATRHQIQEVPDPYYGGREGFEKVIDLLLDSCEGLLEYVKSSL